MGACVMVGKFVFLLLISVCAAVPAIAAEKIAFGPIPAWIRPTMLPSVAKGEEAPVQFLLSDEQLRIETDSTTVYIRTAFKIANSQGMAAGNITLPWRPEFDDVTVHSLLIKRGDKVIDVLSSGQTFTVLRREANLEQAVLDGMLTGSIHPEGLQVGDIIDMEVSIRSSNPTLRGSVGLTGANWNGIPVGRGHLSVEWPVTMKLRYQPIGGLPEPQASKQGQMSKLELTLDNIQPILPPKGAPARYSIGRALDLSSFASWKEAGAIEAPLYQKAAVIPALGPLRDEVERIRKSTADPIGQAEGALALVQERIRYVALSMGLGGMVPANADTTWSRRFGDCKGKTALLLAMLHEFGIEAVPVAVSSRGGDGIDRRLPMLGLFDHILVRARIGGKTYWLDGTRTGDTDLSRIRVPGFGWGLEIMTRGGGLVPMVAAPLDIPSYEVSAQFDATKGILTPAPAKLEAVYRGDTALGLNAIYSQLAAEARDQLLRTFWKEQYSFVEVKASNATFDKNKGELRLTMTGEAQIDWSDGSFTLEGSRLGYKADFKRPPGQFQNAPIRLGHPAYTKTTHTMILPAGFADENSKNSPDFSQTLAGTEYRRHAQIKANVLTVEASSRTLVPEVSYQQALADEKGLRDLFDHVAWVRVPNGYRPTDSDIAAQLATKPTTAREFISRGHLMLERMRIDDALADFNQALVLEPKNSLALANRGITHFWKGDITAAEKDLDTASKINPRNAVVFRARGVIAESRGEYRAAVDAFSTSLEIESNNGFSLSHRAQAYMQLGEKDRALADATAALAIQPRAVDFRLFRANIYSSRQQKELALGDADWLVATMQDDGYAQVSAAAIYSRFGRRDDAAKAIDRALAIKPEAYIYLNRTRHRPKSDLAGRSADIQAALKLEPDNVDGMGLKAELLEERGEHLAAIELYSKAIAANPTFSWLKVRRGVAYSRIGRSEEATKDFAAIRSSSPKAADLNGSCWIKATAGIALESALADCDAALRLSPGNSAYLDSRGLVLLRLGRFDESIADYNQAIAKTPRALSYMGRAMAWSRKGDAARAEADRQAAGKLDEKSLQFPDDIGLKF